MGKKLILAIDDEKDILKLLQYNLEREGYQVLCAKTGEEGLESVRSKRPDLVILDVMMPGIDGLEAARRIRTAEGDAVRTPIIALTANAFAEDREACLAAGMDGFLVKPLDRDRLASALENLPDRAAIAA